MGLFRRRSVDTGQALEMALSRVLDAQAKNVEVMGGFLEKMGELSIKRAAQALGARGGLRRAENAKRKKASAAGNPDCRLCADPFTTHLSPAEVDAHRLHKKPEQPSLIQ